MSDSPHPLQQRFPDWDAPFHVLFNPDCLLHDTGPNHPERVERLQAVLEGCTVLPDSTPVHFRIPQPADRGSITLVHALSYIQALEECCLSGQSSFMSPDNPICPDSYQAILASGGLGVALGQLLADGGAGFALTRPPGHHAGKAQAEGFCFLNQIGLAIETIRSRFAEASFLVVDFDVHHGNGIHYLYNQDSSVYFFSIHGSPAHIYPGTGFESETGIDDGEGFTKNITIEQGTTGKEWVREFKRGLKESLSDFTPDFILVSAGFDAHNEDPYSFVRAYDSHFIEVIELLEKAAKKHCRGRIGLTLEGGYSLDVLRRLVPEVIQHLADWKAEL